ncbi:MAG TPA: hypothetical protein VFZ34_15450 [Blastocatellia bacterium]|nr:hypothetical protein [Blastocatellia bacterium]
MTPIAPIMLGGYVVITLLSWANPAQNLIVYGLPLAPLVTIFYWHLTYGKLQSNDPDFQQAQKDVRKSLLIWIPTSLVLILFLLYWFFR